MANQTPTAGSVFASAGAVKLWGVAGGAVTAGMPLYLDANGKLQAADADGTGTTSVIGIATNGAALNQPVQYVVSDPNFKPGFVTVAGTIYSLSSGAGLWSDSAPTAPSVTTVLGVGKLAGIAGTGTVTLGFVTAGVAVA